MRKNG
jgi:hypothetical protein